MKTLLLLPFLLFLGLGASAQHDFSKADSMALSYKGKYIDVSDLALQLTQPFTSDLDKARVLFMWVAEHVRYDVAKFQNPPPRPRISAKTEEEMLAKKSEQYAKSLQETLRTKKGICQDYSQLYKALCDAAGLDCEIVRGDARDFYKPYRVVHDNPHAWNAIKIDGKWHLLDATWAAGYVRNGKFTRKLSPGFFMTPPAWFAQNHFPDSTHWQLLEVSIDKKTFPSQPMVNFGQMEYPLIDFSQNLEKTANGDVVLLFKFSKVPKAFMVANGQSRKPIKFTQKMEDGWVVLRFSPRGQGDVAVFMGDRVDEKMGWLARYDIK